MLLMSIVSAQKSDKKITITGTVLDAANSPIVNSIIMIDGKNTSSVTDSKGNYKIKVKPGASTIGIFTFGNGIIEEPINGRTMINFNFREKTSQQTQDQNIKPGEEEVNVGYGNVKKKNLTSPVTKIDGTNKKYVSYHSISEMIQREIPGVKLIGSSVIIQGSSNFLGDVPALIVVDGVNMDNLPDIPPSAVESIEFLKGSAASIYGSRGAGGVLLIKTTTGNHK
jgi:TonB-dependent SusC/RagA subfamily outer membrane receptor